MARIYNMFLSPASLNKLNMKIGLSNNNFIL